MTLTTGLSGATSARQPIRLSLFFGLVRGGLNFFHGILDRVDAFGKFFQLVLVVGRLRNVLNGCLKTPGASDHRRDNGNRAAVQGFVFSEHAGSLHVSWKSQDSKRLSYRVIRGAL